MMGWVLAHLYRTKAWLADATCAWRYLPPSARVEAPYFSQFMSADLVDKYIGKEVPLHMDPRWAESGASTPEEYERWTWCDCGIACLKMILAATDEKYDSLKLVTLAQNAQRHGVYKIQNDNISSLHYAEFCDFVRSVYGLHARTVSALSLCEIKDELKKGNFVIISVHPSIRHPDATPPKRGGHLVLAVGYDDARGGFFIHNPSGYQSNSSQEGAFVPYGAFKKFFAYRGIIVRDTLFSGTSDVVA